jgi:hypothetical protein
MRKAARITGVLLLVLAGLLGLLGIWTLPQGGLMFALPFFFLFPAAVFALLGLILIFVTREPKKLTDKKNNNG